VNLGLRFALSQPVAAAISPGDEALFRMAVDLAMNFKPVTPAEQKEIEAWGAKVKPIFRHEDKKPANT
jgi:putative lipase involved disintegration of autophagic bodies